MDIITKFKDKFDYVKDIEKVISFLDSTSFSLEEKNDILLGILEWNNKIEEDLTNKHKESENKKAKIKEKQQECPDNNIKNEVVYSETPLIDVSKYIKNIESVWDPEFICDILPSPSETLYEPIIMAIFLHYYQEISELHTLALNYKSEEDRLYCEEELNRLKTIISCIKDYYEENKEESYDDTTGDLDKASLIYLTNTQNEPYAIADINNIEGCDYRFIKAALNEIASQTFTHEKRFHNHSDLKEISCLRKGDSRIIFTRLNSKIVILGIFIKREQNSNSYRDILCQRARAYRELKPILKEKIQESEFLAQNDLITEEIINTISGAKKKEVTPNG